MEAFPPIDSRPSGCLSSERVTRARSRGASRLALVGAPPAGERDGEASIGLSGLGGSRRRRWTRTPSSRRSPKASTEIMAEDRELALDWRLKTRELFRRLLRERLRVKGFHRSEEGAFYRLEREEDRLRTEKPLRIERDFGPRSRPPSRACASPGTPSSPPARRRPSRSCS